VGVERAFGPLDAFSTGLQPRSAALRDDAGSLRRARRLPTGGDDASAAQV
jgi:hypothetical protein